MVTQSMGKVVMHGQVFVGNSGSAIISRKKSELGATVVALTVESSARVDFPWGSRDSEHMRARVESPPKC